MTKNIDERSPRASGGDGAHTTMSHGSGHSRVNPAHDDGRASRNCLPPGTSASTCIGAVHGSIGNGRKPSRRTAASSEHLMICPATEDLPDEWECEPPGHVHRKALRTLLQHESLPVDTGGDPNHAEEASQDGEAAQPTDPTWARICPNRRTFPPWHKNWCARESSFFESSRIRCDRRAAIFLTYEFDNIAARLIYHPPHTPRSSSSSS